MAIKLSSYYWFRNNHLVQSIEDNHTGEFWFGYKELTPEDRKVMDSYNGGLTPSDKNTLKFIVEELDGLKEKSYFCNGHPNHEENFRNNVIIMNLVELKDITSDKELAATYFEGIHKIMERYNVKAEMYKHLGQCFDEISIQPSQDASEAIKYANHKIISERYGELERMTWCLIKKWEREKAELKKTDPLKYWNTYHELP